MINRTSIVKGALVICGIAVALSACDDPAEPGNGAGEQELITQVTITLTPTGGGASQSASINDPDGPGPQPPEDPTATFDLEPGTTYDGTIEFLDTVNNEDITEEVEAENDAHRIFYTIAGVTGVSVPDASLDTDANGAPVGLTFQVEVDAGAASGTGTLRVVLSHYDEEPKGDGSTPSDETDVDVTFDIEVQ